MNNAEINQRRRRVWMGQKTERKNGNEKPVST